MVVCMHITSGLWATVHSWFVMDGLDDLEEVTEYVLPHLTHLKDDEIIVDKH